MPGTLGSVSDAQASRNPPKATPGDVNGGLRDETTNPPYNGMLKEWQAPFDFPEDWPAAAHDAFDAIHATRQAMQKKMDESIAAHADTEILYYQPAASKNKLRITTHLPWNRVAQDD